MSSMILRLRWLAAPPILWTKNLKNQFSPVLLYLLIVFSSTLFCGWWRSFFWTAFSCWAGLRSLWAAGSTWWRSWRACRFDILSKDRLESTVLNLDVGIFQLFSHNTLDKASIFFFLCNDNLFQLVFVVFPVRRFLWLLDRREIGRASCRERV